MAITRKNKGISLFFNSIKMKTNLVNVNAAINTRSLGSNALAGKQIIVHWLAKKKTMKNIT